MKKKNRIRVILKIALSFLVVTGTIYTVTTFMSVQNRDKNDIANSRWYSKKLSQLTFNNDLTLYYFKDNLSDKQVYSYEQKNGHILVYEIAKTEEVIFEFVYLQEHKLFSVTENIVYYDVKYLT